MPTIIRYLRAALLWILTSVRAVGWWLLDNTVIAFARWSWRHIAWLLQLALPWLIGIVVLAIWLPHTTDSQYDRLVTVFAFAIVATMLWGATRGGGKKKKKKR